MTLRRTAGGGLFRGLFPCGTAAALLFPLLPLPLPAAEPTPARVAELVEQLDAPDAVERIAAEAGLLELGPAALDLLPPPERYSGQVRTSLETILKKLQAIAARDSTAGRIVSLQAPETPLPELLARLEKASGNKLLPGTLLNGRPGGMPKAAANFEKVLWWKAVDGLLDETALDADPYSEADTLFAVPRSPQAVPRSTGAAYVEAFRFDARKVTLERHPNLTGPALCRIELGVQWEPRLRPVVFHLEKEGFSATDDRGTPLTFAMPGGALETTIPPGQSAIEVSTLWEAPARAATALKSLRGRLKAVVPGRPTDFVFTAFDKPQVSQAKGDVRIVLEEVRRTEPDGTVWEFRLRLHFVDAKNALESHRQWVANNTVTLLDPAGKEVEIGLLESTHRTSDSVGVAYFFDLPQGPAKHKLTYRTPVLIAERTLEFELKDITLP